MYNSGTGMDVTNSKEVQNGASEGRTTLPATETIREGKAEILKESSKQVFYNPVQEFNRDLR